MNREEWKKLLEEALETYPIATAAIKKVEKQVKEKIESIENNARLQSPNDISKAIKAQDYVPDYLKEGVVHLRNEINRAHSNEGLEKPFKEVTEREERTTENRKSSFIENAEGTTDKDFKRKELERQAKEFRERMRKNRDGYER
jgi:hypothetical protein